jgi:hypothetical protein
MADTFVGISGVAWSHKTANLLGPPGGFGAVYAGDGAGKDVAIKVIDLTGSPASGRDALLREVEIAQKLRATVPCDYLLPALDHAVVGDTLFIVMDRASQSLAAIVGTITEGDALVALKDVANGLVELHGAGVLHRDLKPGNVLFHGGRWKLGDFGISRDVDATTGTVTWAGAGSLRYMAPELFDPPFAVTVKSDLYALGCLSYELLRGRPPFISTDSIEVMRLHKQATPTELDPTISPTLRRLTMRLLLKDPIQRPQDARDALETLSRVVVGSVSPEAGRLQSLASEHMAERTAADAAHQARVAAIKAADDRRDQAIRDLEAIVQEGHDLISEALPEVRYERRGLTFNLFGDDASLRFMVWGSHPQHERQRFAAFGMVDGENRRMRDEPPLGNIVCEIEDGRLVWYLYRYRAGALSHPDERRSPRRPYGFLETSFFGDNVFPFAFRDHKGLHYFQSAHEVLDPQSVQRLYGSALALPDEF